MSDEQGAPKRLSGPLELVSLLDMQAILAKTLKIQQQLIEERPEGIIEPIENITISSNTPRVLRPTSKAWSSVEIVNDGPNDVEILVNPEKSLEYHTVRPNEAYKVELGRKAIGMVLLRCATGETASIRLVAVR